MNCWEFSAKIKRRTSRCSSSSTCRATRSKSWNLRSPDWGRSSVRERRPLLMTNRSFCFKWKIIWELYRPISRILRLNIAIVKRRQGESWALSNAFSRLFNVTGMWRRKSGVRGKFHRLIYWSFWRWSNIRPLRSSIPSTNCQMLTCCHQQIKTRPRNRNRVCSLSKTLRTTRSTIKYSLLRNWGKRLRILFRYIVVYLEITEP